MRSLGINVAVRGRGPGHGRVDGYVDVCDGLVSVENRAAQAGYRCGRRSYSVVHGHYRRRWH